SEPSDHFGASLAVGDFNGDGYADLAVGVPEEDVKAQNAGAVQILYGSRSGLSANNNQFWYQGKIALLESDAEDWFGYALAAGDFNGDGYADLAVSAPLEDIDNIVNAGVVNVLFGSHDGLTHVGYQLWHQNSLGILDQAEDYDAFGWTLAAGDLNG